MTIDMSAMVDKLFIQSQAEAIKKLWNDKGSRFLIQKEIGKKLMEHQGIIDDLPLTQIMFIVSLSTFASSENECYEVAEIIYWGIHRADVLPMVTEHKGKDLANRCLISLGLFKGALIRRWERHGAPSPSFYRKAGIYSFNEIGMGDIGNHFGKWENFLSEFFVLNPCHGSFKKSSDFF